LSTRVEKTQQATPRVRGKFVQPRSREGKNTASAKEFRGGTIYIETAGSAANLAEVPARYGYGDEIDDWEVDLQGQGDPTVVFENRGSTYGRRRKWFYSSSPKKPPKLSKIHALFLKGDQRYYEVPCPHCDHFHVLKWENMRTDEDVTWARMVCPACGTLIEEAYKTKMLARGRWVATAKSLDGTVSFTISQLYAPLGWTSWLELAQIYADAEKKLKVGDHTPMQAFHNTRLALCYDNAPAATTAQKLKSRPAHLPRVVPVGGWVVTASVDTQPNRLEVQVEAWGPGMERWVIEYQKLMGSPSVPPDTPGSVWKRLDAIRDTPWPLAIGGKPILISAYMIDSGGSNTQDVYNYGAARRHKGCLIIKGSSRPNRPIVSSAPSNVDIEWGGAKIQGGAQLWSIGTDTAKDYIFNRLPLESGPGATHFHSELDEEWFDGLLAERAIVKYKKGQAVRSYEKAPGDANEPLDLSVYNLATAHHLGLHRWSENDWKRLRDKLAPEHRTLDLFASTPPLTAVDVAGLAARASDERIPALVSRETPAPSETVHTSERSPTAPTQPPPSPPQLIAAVPSPRPVVSPPRVARRIFSRGIQ
jgi:phage terminase large subunit GpA-like protein